MKALLLHDIVPDGAAAAALGSAGHEVVRCSPSGTRSFPCRGITDRCPLDGTVDVAVVVHGKPTTDVAPGEVGAICARRDGIPLVVVGTGARTPLYELAAATAASLGDLPDACERVLAGKEARLGRAVGGTVRLAGGRVKVALPAWATTADVVRAHQYLTEAVPAARSIDVAIGQ